MATPEIDLKKIHDVFADAADKIGGISKQNKDEFDVQKEPSLLEQFKQATKKIDDAEAAAKEDRKKQHAANAKAVHNAKTPQQTAALKTNMALMEKQQTASLNSFLTPLEKQKKEIKDELKPVEDPLIKAATAAKKIRDMTDETKKMPGKELDEEALSKNISEFYNDLAHAVNAINVAEKEAAKSRKKSALSDYKEPLLKILESTNEVNTDLLKKGKIAKFVEREESQKEASPALPSAKNAGGNRIADRNAAVEAFNQLEKIYPDHGDGEMHITRKPFLDAHLDLKENFMEAKKTIKAIVDKKGDIAAADVEKFHSAMKKTIEGAETLHENIKKGTGDVRWLEGANDLPRQLKAIEDKLQQVPDLKDKSSSVTGPSKAQFAMEEADPAQLLSSPPLPNKPGPKRSTGTPSMSA